VPTLVTPFVVEPTSLAHKLESPYYELINADFPAETGPTADTIRLCAYRIF